MFSRSIPYGFQGSSLVGPMFSIPFLFHPSSTSRAQKEKEKEDH
jgi:hypothetical protein